MSVIDEVKQKADIVEVIGQYTTLKKAGRNLTALCPFHSEKSPSFYVYPEQQSWHCFGACSTGGDVFSFVMKKENMDFGEALRLLAQRSGVTIPAMSGPGISRQQKGKLYQVNEAAARYFHKLLLNSPAGEKARNYLAKRGVAPKTFTDFQLGYSLDNREALKKYLMGTGCTEGELLQAGLVVLTEEGKTYDRFSNLLMFPILDDRGYITGFGARVLDDSLPKYLNSPQTPIFDKSRNLYGIDRATPAIKQQNLVVIVEGYMDVIIAHQYGFSNVVALMGTAINDKKANALKKLTRNVALALDADAAGEDAWLKFTRDANAFEIDLRLMVLPQGKDPDDVIKEDTMVWQRLVSEAPLVSHDIDYIIDTVIAGANLANPKGKSLVADRLLPIIAEIKDSIRQDHYLTKLAKMTGISYNRLEASLSKVKSERSTRKPKPETVSRSLHPLLSSPVEEYLLALLLQHPELKNREAGLLAKYFENSQNREIFIAWQQTNDLPSLKARLAPALGEHLDTLINKSMPGNKIELKYTDCLLNLRQKFLQNQEARKAGVLALEAEGGDTAASLAKLEEQGIEASIGLREVFIEKARKGQEHRR